MDESREGIDRALKLSVVLSRAASSISRHAQADAARHGLTIAEFAVLEALYHGGRPLMLGEVQRKILVTSGGVTYLIDRLAKKGLVERRDCEKDRRATYAALTADGEARMAEIFPVHARALAHALDGLTADQQEQAISLLRTLGRHAAEATLREE